jgi:hypothetical protein
LKARCGASTRDRHLNDSDNASTPEIGDKRFSSARDSALRCRPTDAAKLIVRIGFGRHTDAISGFAKTTPVFSTDASKVVG